MTHVETNLHNLTQNDKLETKGHKLTQMDTNGHKWTQMDTNGNKRTQKDTN